MDDICNSPASPIIKVKNKNKSYKVDYQGQEHDKATNFLRSTRRSSANERAGNHAAL